MTMYRVALILIVATMFGASREAIAQNTPPDPESLISRLASTQQQLGAQAPPRVDQARAQLTALGTTAFPALIAHRNDRRYSYSIEGEGFYNYPPNQVVRIDTTVGQICVQVIAGQLFVGNEYQGCVQFIPDVVSEKTLPEWWKARSSKSLAELRKEALEQTIAEEKRRSTQGDPIGDQCAKDRVNALEADLRAMQSNEKQPTNSRQPQSAASPGQLR